MRNKGITLVALVVSIIIMLILAGVTLNIALGENGLFKMSEKTVEKYKEEAGKEENALQKGSEEIANVIESLKPPVVIDEGEVASKLKEYQGKYVDIGLDTNGDSKVNDWELFYAGNDRIYLIAADYVLADTLTEWEVIGDKGKLSEFQKYNMYCVRWPNAPTEFLDLPDLNLAMHITYDLDANQGNPSSIAVSQLLNTDAWNGIKEKAGKKDCIDFAMGGPTLEMWCAAWNKAIEENENGFVKFEAEPSTSELGYKVKTNGTDSQYWAYMDGTQISLSSPKLTALGTTYKTFFPHTEPYQICNGYWLASSSANYSNYLLGVSFEGRVDRYDFTSNYRGVRPVVCLQSGVKLQKNTAESTEEKTVYDIVK